MVKKIRRLLVPESIVQKIYHRQTFGRLLKPLRVRGSSKLFFDTCPQHSQIPLHQVLGEEVFRSGHVALGFTIDGRYLLSYLCKVDSDNFEDALYVTHHYTLQWWEFNYKARARKVLEVPLFGKEEIHQELHLLVSQAQEGQLIVVHGSPFMQSDSEASNRECYVTVVRSLTHGTETIERLPIVTMKYESLPPYPLFNPSVNLKIKGVVLINSGDAVQAVNVSILFQSDSTVTREQCSLPIVALEKENDRGVETLTSEIKPPLFQAGESVSDGCFTQSCESPRPLPPSPTTVGSLQLLEANQYRDLIYCPDQFCCCVEHAFTLTPPSSRTDHETEVASPGGLSVHVSQIGDTDYMSHTTKKIAFPGLISPGYNSILRAVFDAEKFVSTILAEWETLYDAYFVLRDYDMQIAEACNARSEVVLMLKYLVAVNEKTADKLRVKGYQKYYTTGFLLTWNVSNGNVRVLQRDPFKEYSYSGIKSKRFCPGYNATAELRKKWFTPKGYQGSIFTFSNHTTITGKSLRYIVHPFQPLALIL